MADQYGLAPEDYVYDLKNLSSIRYIGCMPIIFLSFSKQWLKQSQGIVATLMVYDFIYHIPQQVRRSTRKQRFHTSLCPRFSTSTSMFPIQWSTIVTDMQTQEEVVEAPCHLFFHPDD